MVASDYRLERVCARLIERLESARRTYAGFPQRASAAFNHIAAEHVEAAIREYRGVAMADHPDRQATLLRREVMATFLPRYTRLAVAMTQREEGSYGFGPFAEPFGRLLLGAVGLLLVFSCWRVIRVPVLWPLLLGFLLLPFVADIGGWLISQRYRRRLETVLSDMKHIQDSEGTYLSAEELRPDGGAQVLHLVPPDSEDDESD